MSSDDQTLVVDERGQLILLAAAVIALALVAGAVAYLQVGYHPDVERGVDHDSEGITAGLDRTVANATGSIPDTYTWDQRETAVETVDDRIEPRLQAIEESRLESGIAYEITANETAADTWAEEDCPSGQTRQFGPCEAIDGVVVQERVGETHVLGLVVDVRMTSNEQRRTATIQVSAVKMAASSTEK